MLAYIIERQVQLAQESVASFTMFTDLPSFWFRKTEHWSLAELCLPFEYSYHEPLLVAFNLV